MKSPAERLILIVDSRCAKFFHTNNFKMKGEIHLINIEDCHIHHKTFHSHGHQAHHTDGTHDVKSISRSEFTKYVMHKILDEYHNQKFIELVLIAGPKIIGDLRHSIPKELIHLSIREIQKDLSHFSKNEIEQYLHQIC